MVYTKRPVQLDFHQEVWKVLSLAGVNFTQLAHHIRLVRQLNIQIEVSLIQGSPCSSYLSDQSAQSYKRSTSMLDTKTSSTISPHTMNMRPRATCIICSALGLSVLQSPFVLGRHRLQSWQSEETLQGDQHTCFQKTQFSLILTSSVSQLGHAKNQSARNPFLIVYHNLTR